MFNIFILHLTQFRLLSLWSSSIIVKPNATLFFASLVKLLHPILFDYWFTLKLTELIRRVFSFLWWTWSTHCFFDIILYSMRAVQTMIVVEGPLFIRSSSIYSKHIANSAAFTALTHEPLRFFDCFSSRLMFCYGPANTRIPLLDSMWTLFIPDVLHLYPIYFLRVIAPIWWLHRIRHGLRRVFLHILSIETVIFVIFVHVLDVDAEVALLKRGHVSSSEGLPSWRVLILKSKCIAKINTFWRKIHRRLYRAFVMLFPRLHLNKVNKVTDSLRLVYFTFFCWPHFIRFVPYVRAKYLPSWEAGVLLLILLNY